MAELTPRERLQPSLLDRLTDYEPDKKVESRDQRVLSLAKLRECVMRDLTWLLNAENMASRQRVSECPEAMQSVINYGIPASAGATSTGRGRERLERQILEAIYTFEPRLIRDTVSVRTLPSSREMSKNAIEFEIEADLWAQPLPQHLYFQTEVDLDTGTYDVADRSA